MASIDAGVAPRRPRAYLAAMRFLALFSPTRAARDLRTFLAQRRRHELVFATLALLATTMTIYAFVKDSHFERPYKREIVYFQNWPLDRSDEQIRAQQAIDGPIEAKARADLEKREAERRASFKRLDDKLESWGL